MLTESKANCLKYQMSSLNEESGFNRLMAYYQKNKDRPWKEWLEVVRIFPRPGKQGLVGLMSAKEDKTLVYVFKVSQYINYLVHHELTVMNSLNEIADYCPNFCRSIGSIICNVDPNKRKEGNPFECESKYKIEKEILLAEYLDNSYKFCNYIFSKKISEDTLYCTIKQVLLSIVIAQKQKQFTHYDLHSNNIMMKRCSKDLVFLYVIDQNNQFCVSTRGSYPVIIDYGFSYTGDMNGQPLWPTLNHTEVGFLSDRFDPIADPKLFLVTVSDEIHEAKKSKKSRKLLNITKNIYGTLPIDWDSGWDNDTDKCATDYVLKKLKKYCKVSPLFKHYEYYCMDIVQTLIIMPLEKQKVDHIEIPFLAFLKEFTKIENEISAPFYCLYILKGLVDAARTVRIDYANKETREHAVGYFRHAILERIDSVAKYCRPKDIHYEKMLCSLLCLTKCMEGLLYEAMEKRIVEKRKMYKQVPLQTPEEIVVAIDINIEDDYEFNHKTNVLVIDNIKKACYPLELTVEQKQEINSYSSISRGPEMYKILQNISIK
jgi:hypothetical protein